MKIGFIGLGLMGAPLARRIVSADKDVLLYNRTASKIEPVACVGKNAKAAKSFHDFKDCDLVFTCLALPQHVLAAVVEDGGIYECLPKGAIHVECSTIGTDTSRAIAEAAKKKGIHYLQCTLNKSPVQAEKGETPLFLGGDKQDIEEIKDILSLMGTIHYVGTQEQACAVKILSNLMGMSNLAILAEGIKLGDALGIDREKLLELLVVTGAHSFQMAVRGPWIAHKDYNPRFSVDLALKDIRLGYKMAQEVHYEPTLMADTMRRFEEAQKQGLGQQDCAAITDMK